MLRFGEKKVTKEKLLWDVNVDNISKVVETKSNLSI